MTQNHDYGAHPNGWSSRVEVDTDGTERDVTEHTSGSQFTKHDDGTFETTAVDAKQLPHTQFILRRDNTGTHRYNVADYTQDGRAIQAAVDDLPADGGHVQLPMGDFTVDSTIQLPGGNNTVTLRGYGVGFGSATNTSGTRLLSGISDGTPVIKNGTSSANARGNILRDFMVIGSTNDGDGILSQGWMQNGYAKNIHVQNVGGHGFHFIDSWSQEFARLRARNCGSNGFNLVNCNATAWVGCHGQGNTGHGYEIAQTHSGSLVGCTGEGNDGTGFNALASSDGLSFNGCYTEKNTTHGLKINGPSITIDGGHHGLEGQNGILLSGASKVSITGPWMTQDTGNYINISNSTDVEISGVTFNGSATTQYQIGGTTTDVIVTDDESFNGGTATASSGVASVTFDAPFSSRPKLSFGRVGGGINGVTFTTDANGNYNGADITVSNSTGTIDWSATF